MSGRHHVIVIGGGRSLQGNNRSGRHHVIVIGGGSRSSNLEKTSEIAILSDGVDRDSKGESGTPGSSRERHFVSVAGRDTDKMSL